MKKLDKVLFFALSFATIFLLDSCDILFGPPVINTAVVRSVSPLGLNVRHSRSLDIPYTEYRWFDSAAPDSLTVTLKRIEVESLNTITQVWVGSQELILQGDGIVDLGSEGLELSALPTTKIDKISLVFDDRASIQGTLTGDFYNPANAPLDTSQVLTVKTKTAYGDVPAAGTSYSVYEGGVAEPASVSLGNTSGEITVETKADFTRDPKVATTLTILVDLSRMLRFDSGIRSPADASTSAHFFCNSVFSSSVAAFFGIPGKIQGYSTLHSTEHYIQADGSDNTNNVKEIVGWLTLAFDAEGNFLSGMAIGDDDNTLTISKGILTDWTANPSAGYDFYLGVSQTTVSGFEPASQIGLAAPDLSYSAIHGTERITGHARFTLEFQTP